MAYSADRKPEMQWQSPSAELISGAAFIWRGGVDRAYFLVPGKTAAAGCYRTKAGVLGAAGRERC